MVRDDLLDECDECGNRLVFVGDVAFEREIGRIDLQQQPVLDDRFVLDLKRSAERREIVRKRVVMLVAHRRGEDAGRRRAHERLDKDAGIFRQDRIEMAAFVVDRAIVEIAHLADRLRQPAERRDLGLAGVLLDPHALEVRIAVDIGARRPLPAAAESRQPRLEIEKEGIALLLAVVADVDAGVVLLAHDRPHRFAAGAIDFGRIDRVAARAQRVEPRQARAAAAGCRYGSSIFSKCCAASVRSSHLDMWCGSHSASSGQKITIASTTNMIRWNGIVPSIDLG